MRKLYILLLLLVIIYCITYPSVEHFDTSDQYVHYSLQNNKLLQGENIIFNIKGNKLEPTDPSIYGELIIENDKIDYNGNITNISYYKRKKNYITISLDNSPLTFSMGNPTSISYKNSEIGTLEKGPGDAILLKIIAHPDATKYLPYIVAGYIYWKSVH